MISVIILAAGASTRLGRPKQLLAYRGTTLLQYTIRETLHSLPTPVIVVLGAHAELIRPVIEREAVYICENPDWESGMGSSIGAGMRALQEIAPACTYVILMLCDQPFADRTLLRQLVEEKEASGKGIVASAYGQTLGVPALFDRAYFEELKALPAREGAKTILRAYQEEVAAVAFPKGLLDIDTAEDYEHLVTLPTIPLLSMTEFELQGHPFITLTNLLKALGLVGTGGEANLYIVDGDVRVNGEVERQKRKKIWPGDEVEFQGRKIVVR